MSLKSDTAAEADPALTSLENPSLWIDAQKSASFPRKFPAAVFDVKLFLPVLLSTSILVFPPGVLFRDVSHLSLGVFFSF